MGRCELCLTVQFWNIAPVPTDFACSPCRHIICGIINRRTIGRQGPPAAESKYCTHLHTSVWLSPTSWIRNFPFLIPDSTACVIPLMIEPLNHPMKSYSYSCCRSMESGQAPPTFALSSASFASLAFFKAAIYGQASMSFPSREP